MGLKRYELSEAQWVRIAPMLPGKSTDPGRTGADTQTRRMTTALLGRKSDDAPGASIQNIIDHVCGRRVRVHHGRKLVL